MNQTVNPLTALNSMNATSTSSSAVGKKGNSSGHWFEAMASAWGETLDKTASKIEGMSEELQGGNDTPGLMTMLSTETMRMGFISNSAKTCISSAGTALETMARKG
jgi:hypothetical protein